jgi:hypothetical protein
VEEKPNRCCSLDPNVVHLVQSTEHIRVKGYLQCEGYFKGYYDDICTLFEPPDQIITNIGTKYPTFETDSYFMHIRLGDYLSSHAKPVHFINLSHYYVKCLERLHNQAAKIYVFSNECVDQCVHIYPILQTLKDRLVFINEPDQLTMLRLMTMCSLGGICANSSFSWWGAYLNKNPTKEVYMPSEWTTNKAMHNDIYFPKKKKRVVEEEEEEEEDVVSKDSTPPPPSGYIVKKAKAAFAEKLQKKNPDMEENTNMLNGCMAE